MENHCGNLDKKSYNMKNNFMNRIVEFAIATAFAVLPVSCRELPFETQILSYEGNFLLKIFRQTGDRRYLELCKDISHNVVQYVNTKTNHVQPGDNVGWCTERVNISDWEGADGVGNVPHDSNCAWENVNLYHITEVPGIYVQPDGMHGTTGPKSTCLQESQLR